MPTREKVYQSWWEWVCALANCTRRWHPGYCRISNVWVYCDEVYSDREHDEYCGCDKCRQWRTADRLQKEHVAIRDTYERMKNNATAS